MSRGLGQRRIWGRDSGPGPWSGRGPGGAGRQGCQGRAGRAEGHQGGADNHHLRGAVSGEDSVGSQNGAGSGVGSLGSRNEAGSGAGSVGSWNRADSAANSTLKAELLKFRARLM